MEQHKVQLTHNGHEKVLQGSSLPETIKQNSELSFYFPPIRQAGQIYAEIIKNLGAHKTTLVNQCHRNISDRTF